MSTLASLWAARSARERSIVAITTSVALLALFIALVGLPLERARTHLAGELPALRASVAHMRLEADEAKRLRSLPAREPQATPATLIASATFTQGLPGASARALDARRIRVAAADASWNAVIAWVERAQSTLGLSVESATIEALPATGRVRAELIVVGR